MIDRIVKRDGRVVPFNRDKITFAVLSAAVAVGGRDRATAERVTDEVIRLLEQRAAPDSIPTVEEVQDLVEKALIERGHARTAKAYIVYRYEHALKRAGRRSLTYSADNIPYEKLWEALSWAVDHGCVRLAEIAAAVRQGPLRRAGARGGGVLRRRAGRGRRARSASACEELRLVIVAGPSSSGKTTTTIKIEERLRPPTGASFVPINVDNFFLDLAEHPRDTRGDYDFETPQALDLALINDTLRAPPGRGARRAALLQLQDRAPGGQLRDPPARPRPDPADRLAARAAPRDDRERCPRSGSSGCTSRPSPRSRTARGQFVRWADVRLLRRMVRDMQFRNYSPAQTIQHWHLVRRSELRYIVPRLRAGRRDREQLPALRAADHEAPAGRTSSRASSRSSPRTRSAPTRWTAPGASTSCSSELPAWSDESVVPADSLLREFIGGSRYKY